MKKLFLFIFLFISIPSFAQTSIGIEAQAYPAGIIPGIRFDLGLTSNLTLNSRFGYNSTDRRDWGKHENEEGGGLGFGLGLEKSSFLTKNLSITARIDFWLMEIDWLSLEGCAPNSSACGRGEVIEIEGKTDITVMQPTFGVGYQLPNTANFILKPTLSFGYEINIATDGESVGEGAILLAGFQFGFRL